MEAPLSKPLTVEQPGGAMKPQQSQDARAYSALYTHRPPGRQRIKRAFDLIFSLIALLVFSMPSTIIAVLLTCKERHPIFFRQERIGKNKKRFMILKFQTMVDLVPTETGKILRKTGLDELPQFLNVLKGDMSIVGPRALTQSDIQRLGWDDSYHKIRWDLKPGITGFAQLYGGQHRKTSWFWDKHYIKMNNPLVDPAIIVVSFLMNVFGKTNVRKIVFRKSNLR